MKLAPTSLLALGARGKFKRKPFTIVGRTCLRSEAGLWNEHRIVFDDRTEATLAEARGGFAVFTEGKLPEIPRSASPGDVVGTWVVVERGEAERAEIWGDAPKTPRSYAFVDLSSRKGEPATVADRGYRGVNVSLESLGLPIANPVAHLLPAPRKSPSPRPRLVLPIGAEAKLGGVVFRVVGALGRAIDEDEWHEYFLVSPTAGWRWLAGGVDVAWTMATLIEAGLVETPGVGVAVYEGATYKYRTGGTAQYDWAAGELPMKLRIGDVATTHTFSRDARNGLSVERTESEITWCRTEYVPIGDMRRGFGKNFEG